MYMLFSFKLLLKVRDVREVLYVVMCRSDVLITNLSVDISYDGLCSEMRDICKFDSEQPFTVKWVDEEGMIHSLSACIVQ